MKNLFECSSSAWVRFSAYECRKAKDGHEYIIPKPNAKPSVYDPFKDAENMVIEALKVGMLCMKERPDSNAKKAMMEFISHYGLLGLMCAIPTTPDFMDYEAVYLIKNQYIRAETMETKKYLDLFQPFDKLDIKWNGKKTTWNVNSDRLMLAVAMTFSEEPLAQQFCHMREYGERYDWLVKQFRDWAFAFYSSYLYYHDYDSIDEDTRNIYRMGMAAFDGIAPTYHIALRDKATFVWDYHSLLLAIQMMFSFMLTDENNTMKLCKNCGKLFLAKRSNAQFCSPQCKNQFNSDKDKPGSK